MLISGFETAHHRWGVFMYTCIGMLRLVTGSGKEQESSTVDRHFIFHDLSETQVRDTLISCTGRWLRKWKWFNTPHIESLLESISHLLIWILCQSKSARCPTGIRLSVFYVALMGNPIWPFWKRAENRNGNNLRN